MKIKCLPYSTTTARFNLGASMKHSVLSDSSPVDEFYRTESCSKNGVICVSYSNPLHVLLNQQRINSIGAMGVEQIKQWLMGSNSSPLQELRKNLSDDDIISLIKDKNLQSPAEILAWSKFCQSNMDEFKSSIQSVVDKLKSDPVPPPSNPE